MTNFVEKKESLIKEIKKQSRKLIDINDKGYNAYRISVDCSRNYYGYGHYTKYMKIESDHLFERVVFLAPKDIEITLDNILEYCNLWYGENRYINSLLSKELNPKIDLKDKFESNNIEEFNINSPFILEKVESGKLPESIFNYIIAQQNMSEDFSGGKNKILVMTFTEWLIDERAINWVLKLFGKDPKELLERVRNRSISPYSMESISKEEYYKKFEELVA